MRRAGWEVRALPEEAGSFEENPPTLSDFVKRDLRWCQGNWQYLHLVGRPGLHCDGAAAALARHPDVRVGPGLDPVLARRLRPRDRAGAGRAGRMRASTPRSSGTPMPWEPWALLAATMTLVFAPKLAGVAQVLLVAALASRLWRRRARGRSRPWSSSLFSFILAPIMAVGAERLPAGHVAGRTIRWEAQLRDPRVLGWARGVARSVAADPARPGPGRGRSGASAPEPARLWAVLFCGPLLLAVPFAVVTSWTGAGPLARAPGDLRRARGGRAAAGRRGLRPRRRLRRRPPVGGGRGRRCRGRPRHRRSTDRCSAGLAEADIGCGRVNVCA